MMLNLCFIAMRGWWNEGIKRVGHKNISTGPARLEN